MTNRSGEKTREKLRETLKKREDAEQQYTGSVGEEYQKCVDKQFSLDEMILHLHQFGQDADHVTQTYEKLPQAYKEQAMIASASRKAEAERKAERKAEQNRKKKARRQKKKKKKKGDEEAGSSSEKKGDDEAGSSSEKKGDDESSSEKKGDDESGSEMREASYESSSEEKGDDESRSEKKGDDESSSEKKGDDEAGSSSEKKGDEEARSEEKGDDESGSSSENKGDEKEQADDGPLSPSVQNFLQELFASYFERMSILLDKRDANMMDKINKQIHTCILKENAISSGLIIRTIEKNMKLEEEIRYAMKTEMIPKFDRGCQSLFDQIDRAFGEGMKEHIQGSLEVHDSSIAPLISTLEGLIKSSLSLYEELKRRLLEAGANPSVQAPVDQYQKLTKLLSEEKYEESFYWALRTGDVSIVSWLCLQVNLSGVLWRLSQGVLLSLFSHLACDIHNDTCRKIDWMMDVVLYLVPSDETIARQAQHVLSNVYIDLPKNEKTLADSLAIRKLQILIKEKISECTRS